MKVADLKRILDVYDIHWHQSGRIDNSLFARDCIVDVLGDEVVRMTIFKPDSFTVHEKNDDDFSVALLELTKDPMSILRLPGAFDGKS